MVFALCVTVPWTLAIQLIIGIWLMARPDILPFIKVSADCDHLIGALVITVAAIACAEVTRIIRYLNILLGVSLIIVAFLFALPNSVIFCSELVAGILLVILSIPRGAIVERYADWDKYVK